MNLFGSMNVRDNALYIGEISAKSLAENFGTPLYVMDEELMRQSCKSYIENFKVKESGNKVAYAGKAFLTKAMCNLINEEGMCLDVVSGGELYTAYKSGFPMNKIYFHGNNKTKDEIEMGIKLGVGKFVADNFYELELISSIAKKLNKTQEVLLRVTPGIEAHTHSYIKTGQLDSKFGFTVLDNIVLKAVKTCSDLDNIEFMGLHCHIGSQIFETKPYEEEVDILFELANNVQKELGIEVKEIDLGGGFGIYYKKGDEPKSAKTFCTSILNQAEKVCEKLNMKMPILVIEPGRSIVGNAGTTLYSVGSIKEIPSVRKYVSVDGGMTDNIRPALYNSEYECMVCNNIKSEVSNEVRLVGKCCESGDVLINNISITEPKTGDILAVLNTGAYGYSMSSNYNKIPRAAVVLVNKDKAKVICKRQTYDELISNELDL